jgi:hypothetical protein
MTLAELAAQEGIAYKRLHHLVRTKKLSVDDAVGRLK